jgi:hypothetical protein
MKNYYFKLNGSLKYDFLSFFKNLEDSPSQIKRERETKDNSAREIDSVHLDFQKFC